MDSILRATGMYIALMLLFRVAGRRSLADLTTFDFVLLLIIGEATQQALLGEDFSFTNAMLVIATLIVLDVGLSLAKLKAPGPAGRRPRDTGSGTRSLSPPPNAAGAADRGRHSRIGSGQPGNRKRRADQVRHRRAQRQDLDHCAGMTLPGRRNLRRPPCGRPPTHRYVDHPL